MSGHHDCVLRTPVEDSVGNRSYISQMWIPRAIELCLPFLDVESNINRQIPAVRQRGLYSYSIVYL
jgi:hypothetical protein